VCAFVVVAFAFRSTFGEFQLALNFSFKGVKTATSLGP